jgi:hypothetical protein
LINKYYHSYCLKKEEGERFLLPSHHRDLKTDEYTLMIGAEDDSVPYLKAIKVKIT